jgi:hypothetical protein
MTNFLVRKNLRHDGVDYNIGDTVEINDKHNVRQLIELDAIEKTNISRSVKGVEPEKIGLEVKPEIKSEVTTTKKNVKTDADEL